MNYSNMLHCSIIMCSIHFKCIEVVGALQTMVIGSRGPQTNSSQEDKVEVH
jgi:hypothetical protein